MVDAPSSLPCPRASAHDRAQQRDRIESGVLVEIAVLVQQRHLHQLRRDFLQRNEDAVAVIIRERQGAAACRCGRRSRARSSSRSSRCGFGTMHRRQRQTQPSTKATRLSIALMSACAFTALITATVSVPETPRARIFWWYIASACTGGIAKVPWLVALMRYVIFRLRRRSLCRRPAAGPRAHRRSSIPPQPVHAPVCTDSSTISKPPGNKSSMATFSRF